MTKAKIIGIGSYAPEKGLPNQDLEKLVDTSDEWIFSRTGIRERRIAAEDEDTSDMCVAAAAGAFTTSGLEATDIDLIIAGTVTPDYRLPSLSCMIQKLFQQHLFMEDHSMSSSHLWTNMLIKIMPRPIGIRSPI